MRSLSALSLGGAVAVAVLGSLVLAPSVSAQTVAADVSGGLLVSPAGDTMGGWIFLVNSEITVTSLGVFDAGSNGLAGPHQVGLWDSVGNLLASTTVTNASTPVASIHADGQWLFQSIGPVNLGIGQYTIGALYFNNDPDLAVILGSVFSIPEVTHVAGVQLIGAPGLVQPTQGQIPGGIFGPSFLVDNGNGAVPEPSEWAAMGVLGMALGGLALRKRRAA